MTTAVAATTVQYTNDSSAVAWNSAIRSRYAETSARSSFSTIAILAARLPASLDSDIVSTDAHASARRGGLRGGITLAIASLVVFALVLEVFGALVLFATGWESSLALRSGQGHLVYDAERVWKLRPSYSSDLITINAQGFRGPPAAQAKPAGTFRIVALGDSITFGTYDCARHYCPDEDSYPARLAAQLARADAGRRFEVLNAGTEGYNSTKDQRWFRDQFAAYRPDLLIVMTGWNDILESRTTSVASTRRGLLDGVPLLRDADDLLRRYSHAYRALWYGLQSVRGGATAGLETTSSEAAEPPADLAIDPDKIAVYEANLRSIVRMGRASGAQVVLLTLAGALGDDAAIPSDAVDRVRRYYGWTDLRRLATEVSRYNATVRSVASSEGARVIDFAGMVARKGGWRLYALPDINHPTHEAIGSLAAALADELRSSGALSASR